VTTGPVTVDEVRARLGGAPAASDEDLQSSLDVAVAHIVPVLDPEYADPTDWPDDLHDGVLIGAVLTYRNAESPTPAAATLGAQPFVPPISWDHWTRHRLARYVSDGSWVG
jgi:hypothetical protein